MNNLPRFLPGEVVKVFLLTALGLQLTQCAWADTKSTTAKPKTAAPAASKAQTPVKPASDSSGKLKVGTPEFLWKASSDSGATLYLVGTIHLVKPDFYPLPKEMDAALTKARALMVEIDTSKSDPTKIRALIGSKGILGQSDSLTNHVSPETIKALQSSGVDPSMMQTFMQMKPWLVGITLVQTEMQKLGYSPKQAIDAHFIESARVQAKKVFGLETEEFQVEVLAGFSEDLQDKLLLKTLLELKQIKTEAGDLMRAWKEGDTAGMEHLMTKDLKEHPEFNVFQDKLINDRNVTMTDKLEAYLKGADTYMVAVGSAHMIGEKGICELLRKKGYKVEQIKSGDKI